MSVQRVVSFIMMIAIVVVSGTAVAAAVCRHQSEQAHAAALHGDNVHDAATASLEDSAAAAAAKQGLGVDAGAFSLPAFILPDASAAIDRAENGSAHILPADAAKLRRAALPPPLKPPAA